MLDGDRPRTAPGYQVEMMDGEAVLFHPATARVMHLNRSATLIWLLCDGQRTVAEICDLLGSAYPEAEPKISADVRETLRRCREFGALDPNRADANADPAG